MRSARGGGLINHNILSGRVILQIYSLLLGGKTKMTLLLSVYSIRIAVFSNLNWLLATRAALLVKCVMAKRGAELISPSLLANI